MENETLTNACKAIEKHIQAIIRKEANMSPIDIDTLSKDLCALESLKRIESNEYSEGYSENGNSGNSYRRGRAANGRFVSRDGGNSAGYYDGSGNSLRYYDGSSNNSGYSGHSIQDRMVAKLEEMFDVAQSEHERQTVRDVINHLRSN